MEPIKALEILQHKIPGDEICYGCGHEHNCRVHGCALIRPALAALAAAESARKQLDQLSFNLEASLHPLDL